MSVAVVPFRPVGGNRAFFTAVDPEFIAVGPAGSGKTYTACMRLHLIALSTPGVRILMARKVLEDLKTGALHTYTNKIRPGDAGVVSFGGNRFYPAEFRYPNGSIIAVVGMDKPGKVMSSEWDVIYCFTGDTRVESPSPIEKGYKREYSGPLITIRTAAGNELTGTPNHPILTDHGWVPLGELVVGANVISRSRGQEVLVGHPHVDDRPPAIAEIVRSLALSSEGRTERVPGVHMDFHGDGMNGDVDVVTANGKLQIAGQAALAQPVGQHHVGGVGLNQLPLKRLGTFLKHRLTALFATSRVGRHVSERLDPFRITLPAQVGGLAHGERLQPASPEFGLEGRVTNADRGGDTVEPTFPFEVTADRIIHVLRTHTDERGVGHVYNLQTRDHYYVANNIIAHNCNEATELAESDWKALKTRLRNGRLPRQLLMGDCNPSGPRHWLNQRCNDGFCRRITTTHKDNPAYWDPALNDWTALGQQYVQENLSTLTGVEYQRLFLGVWAAAEGLVYPEFSVERHVRAEDVDGWRHTIVADVGSRNPTAIYGFHVAGDERVHINDETYRRNMTSTDIIAAIKEKADAWGADVIYVDPSAKGIIMDLQRDGYYVEGANNDVLYGIQRVHAAFQAGMTIDPSCTNLIDELGMYAYPSNARTETDKPIKDFDHGCDAVRYGCATAHMNSAIDIGVFF